MNDQTRAGPWVELWHAYHRNRAHRASLDAYDQGTPYATTGADEDLPPSCDACEALVEAPGLCLRCQDEEAR